MAPRTANRQSDSKYTGVYFRDSTQSFYCELRFLGPGIREKFYKICPSHDLALLTSDAARYYMWRPGSFTFNLAWSESVIESRCVARSHYERIHTLEEKKRFVQKQTEALIFFFTKFDAGIRQISFPERHAAGIPLDSPPSYRELETGSRIARDEIVLREHQALKPKYLEDMIRLRSTMGHCKNTKPMPADEVQKLNQHMLKLERMISFMELPREELPPDLSFERLGSFEKEMRDYYIVTAKWFLNFDRPGSAIQPDSARHEVPSPESHGTDLQLTGLPIQWNPDTDSTIVRGEIVSRKPMPGEKAHKDEDMLFLDKILLSTELPREELPQELTFEKDSENDKSHRKLDTDLPTARGEIVLRQDGACSANDERDQGVWEKHQDIKQMQLDIMSGLRSSMDDCKKTILFMQPSQLQKLNQRMHDLNGMISFMELPREGLQPELSCEELDAFLTKMLQFYVDTAKWLSGINRANLDSG